MYLPDQIVYDLEKKRPVRIGSNVWDRRSYPARSTHFIKNTGDFTRDTTSYALAVPKTIKEATELLRKNLIVPAAIPPTHCWKCRNWLRNCTGFKKCSEAMNHG
jgi:hypothetical protein